MPAGSCWRQRSTLLPLASAHRSQDGQSRLTRATAAIPSFALLSLQDSVGTEGERQEADYGDRT
jgi:hypothetical protein